MFELGRGREGEGREGITNIDGVVAISIKVARTGREKFSQLHHLTE